MKRDRFIMARVWMTGLLVVAVLGAHYTLALRQHAAERRQLAAQNAIFELLQLGPPVKIVSITPLHGLLPAPESEQGEGPPDHPFIVPVPGDVQDWILQLRIPVTDDERARWIPFEFDGITCYLVPL